MGTCWPWETAATLPSARRREALQRPRGRRGVGHIVAAARLQLIIIIIIIMVFDVVVIEGIRFMWHKLKAARQRRKFIQ